MSKNNHLPDPEPFGDFLKQLIDNNKWDRRITSNVLHQVSARARPDGSSIDLLVRIPAINNIDTFRVNIVLVPHERLPLYLVQQFSVDSPGYLNEKKILDFHNKRYPRSGYDFGTEHSNSLAELWTVSCVKDLAALMQSYDWLARFNHKPTVFNLPQ